MELGSWTSLLGFEGPESLNIQRPEKAGLSQEIHGIHCSLSWPMMIAIYMDEEGKQRKKIEGMNVSSALDMLNMSCLWSTK